MGRGRWSGVRRNVVFLLRGQRVREEKVKKVARKLFLSAQNFQPSVVEKAIAHPPPTHQPRPRLALFQSVCCLGH